MILTHILHYYIGNKYFDLTVSLNLEQTFHSPDLLNNGKILKGIYVAGTLHFTFKSVASSQFPIEGDKILTSPNR